MRAATIASASAARAVAERARNGSRTVPRRPSGERLHVVERNHGQPEPARGPEQGEGEGLDEELREDAPPARAKRRADRDFAEPGHRAGVEKDREVDGDDEDERAGEQLADPKQPHHAGLREIDVVASVGHDGRR